MLFPDEVPINLEGPLGLDFFDIPKISLLWPYCNENGNLNLEKGFTNGA